MLTRRRPFRVAVLCSHRAPGVRTLLEAEGRGEFPFAVVGCVSSEADCAERAWLTERGVTFHAHPIRDFYARTARDAPLRDASVRARYDAVTAALLAGLEPDLVLLAGYLYLLTTPMLSAHPGRIVNVHGSDLAPRGGAAAPRYVGLRAVRDAILAGERETRATAHLVTERLDEGPALLRSWPFPVAPLAADALRWSATDMLKAYAFAHQEWMLRAAWGPLLARTAELFAVGRVAEEAGGVTIDGEPAPWELVEPGALLAARPRRAASARAQGAAP